MLWQNSGVKHKMSNHENEIQRERDFEHFFEWLNSSPCGFVVDKEDEEVRVYFYPLDRNERIRKKS